MITKIAIENFKGIRDRVEVELRPITLLFGPNSAGKSTILHALHYAREIFERHNLDADQTIAGGRYVDLGGFHSFLHQGKEREPQKVEPSESDDGGYGGYGDGSGSGVGRAYGTGYADGSGFGDGSRGATNNRQLWIGISINLTDSDLPEYHDPADYNSYDSLESLFTGITDARIEVGIVWSEQLHAPHVQEYSVCYNGVPFARITSQPGRRLPVIDTVNLDHPILPKRKDMERFVELDSWIPDEADDGNYSGLKFLLSKVRRNAWVPVWEDDTFRDLETLPQQVDALPTWEKRLPLSSWRDDGVSPEPLDPPDREELVADNQEINGILSRLIVGPGELVRDALQQFRYLGPLRETPPREFSPPRFPDPTRWATGLGAWDELQAGSEDFVHAVGDWLGDEDKLNSGYRIERRQFKEIDLADPLIRKLLTGRAFDEADEDARVSLESLPTQARLIVVPCDSDLELRPHDVGIGISQVVPVVATALLGERRLLAIEQPELHIHPRLQAEIADLFVESVAKQQHRFLIETHSEHFILRLQRRIRETSKNTTQEVRQLRSEDVVVYYVNQEDGGTRVRRIEIDKNGEFIQPWPDDFFEIDFYERFH